MRPPSWRGKRERSHKMEVNKNFFSSNCIFSAIAALVRMSNGDDRRSSQHNSYHHRMRSLLRNAVLLVQNSIGNLWWHRGIWRHQVLDAALLDLCLGHHFLHHHEGSPVIRKSGLLHCSLSLCCHDYLLHQR